MVSKRLFIYLKQGFLTSKNDNLNNCINRTWKLNISDISLLFPPTGYMSTKIFVAATPEKITQNFIITLELNLIISQNLGVSILQYKQYCSFLHLLKKLAYLFNGSILWDNLHHVGKLEECKTRWTTQINLYMKTISLLGLAK